MGNDAEAQIQRRLQGAGVKVRTSLAGEELVFPRRPMLLRVSMGLVLGALGLILMGGVVLGSAPTSLLGASLFFTGMPAFLVGLAGVVLGALWEVGVLGSVGLRLHTGRSLHITPQSLLCRGVSIPLEEIEHLEIRRTLDMPQLVVSHRGSIHPIAQSLDRSCLEALKGLLWRRRAQRVAHLSAEGHDLKAPAGPPQQIQALRQLP